MTAYVHQIAQLLQYLLEDQRDRLFFAEFEYKDLLEFQYHELTQYVIPDYIQIRNESEEAIHARVHCIEEINETEQIIDQLTFLLGIYRQNFSKKKN